MGRHVRKDVNSGKMRKISLNSITPEGAAFSFISVFSGTIRQNLKGKGLFGIIFA